MSDMNYEEHCPCGNTIKLSGYKTMVDPHIISWHSIHNRHMNAIAKAIVGKEQIIVPYAPEAKAVEETTV